MTRFYALIPFLVVLFVLMPQAFVAVTSAIGAVETLARLQGRR